MYFSLFLFHHLFPSQYLFMYSNSLIQTSNRKYLPELHKRRSKVHQKKFSQESVLNFDQRETLSPNDKRIGAFVYKTAEFDCRLQYFAEFIQTQKRYLIALVTISILTYCDKGDKNFSCELNSWRIYSLQNISYLSLWLNFGN